LWARLLSQRIDLYSRSPSPEKTIHRAIKFMLDAHENIDRIAPYARENSNSGTKASPAHEQEVGNPGPTYAWVHAYSRRFPDHENTKRLAGLKPDSRARGANPLDALIRSSLVTDWHGGDPVCFFKPMRDEPLL
jgi:hypothetical protein